MSKPGGPKPVRKVSKEPIRFFGLHSVHEANNRALEQTRPGFLYLAKTKSLKINGPFIDFLNPYDLILIRSPFDTSFYYIFVNLNGGPLPRVDDPGISAAQTRLAFPTHARAVDRHEVAIYIESFRALTLGDLPTITSYDHWTGPYQWTGSRLQRLLENALKTGDPLLLQE